MGKPSAHRQAVLLAAESGFSPRTCYRWLTRESVGAGVTKALEAAAVVLSIERAPAAAAAS